MFKNMIVEKFNDCADYSFEFDGISCQVNEVMYSVYDYVTELYFGDKYLRWGRENGEMFSVGDVESILKNKKFADAFVDYFDYCLPMQ
nr:MAG TPA: hypothetical protein [Caudoviricetes sp.]